MSTSVGREYPLEDELVKIEKWDFAKDGSVVEFMEYIRRRWNYADVGYFTMKGKETLEYWLSTGGWSGNEEIIDAMQKNFIFWSICWQSSKRGGHFHFKTKLKLWGKS